MIIDLDFDEHGNLYVLQHATGAVQQAGPGVLIRVTPDRSQSGIYAQYRQGTRETVLPGLNRPTSVAVGPDGAVYVARGNTALGGEVIRFVPPPVAGACSSHEDCNDGNVCTQDKCDKRSGTCEYNPIHHRRACDDGNACTSVDVCDRGVCQGSNLPNGAACSDGNACTQRDTCQAGACTGADPVVCSASDQCHVGGTCNTATGACSNPAAPDGTACADGNACTQTDSCQQGSCTGANPVICSPSDQCHVAGACDTATGACSDPTAPDGTACDDIDTCSGQDACEVGVCTVPGTPVEQIAFVSSRHNPAGVPQQNFAEIYLMNPDGTNVVRVTTNDFGDAFPAFSPDAKGRIVFDSNRDNAPGDPINRSDLFLMKRDGTNQQPLARGGSSASWSPDSQSIAFHRSASGMGLPINPNPGAPAADSDIFVARVCDLLAGLPPTNITNSEGMVDTDASWSPDGTKILFTRFLASDNPLTPASAEVFHINPDGTGLTQLTFNGVEERAPSWSNDGTRITYMCKQGPTVPNGLDNEICVMNPDGSGQTQLTFNTINDATSSFSPDDKKIIFHRGGPGTSTQIRVIILNPDGSTSEAPQPLTSPPGISLFPDWGFVRQRP